MARPKRRTLRDVSLVAAYVRVSTTEQAESGLGLAAQREAIDAEIARRGWTLVELYADEGVSGGVAPEGRPGGAVALGDLVAWLNDRPPGSQMARASSANAAGSR